MRLSWLPLRELRTWGEVRFKSSRDDFDTAGRTELDGFAIVNVAADYRVNAYFLLRGRVDNLFDTAYQEVWGYGAAGISGYLGVTFTVAR